MRIEDYVDSEFTPMSARLAWYPTESKSVFTLQWSKLFTPSAAAKKWDGAPLSTTHCTRGENTKCYAYITMKVTGRQQTQIPGTDTWGTRVRITFQAGTEDKTIAAGWVIAGS